jgi:Ca2+-binding EF-hand superfamily protein
MSSNTYTNLSETSVEITRQVFNKLDTNNTGYISVQQILDALALQNKPATTKPPQWFSSFLSVYNLDETSQITQEDYTSYKIRFPELLNSFESIDANNVGYITVNQINTIYSEIVPLQISNSVIWFENIMSIENLTNQTTLTIDQLLEYENEYNTTHSWNVDFL